MVWGSQAACNILRALFSLCSFPFRAKAMGRAVPRGRGITACGAVVIAAYLALSAAAPPSPRPPGTYPPRFPPPKPFSPSPVPSPQPAPSCYVLERDWPKRTCVLHVDDCRTQYDCTVCQRGYGAYPTMEACLNPGAGQGSTTPATGATARSPSPKANTTSPTAKNLTKTSPTSRSPAATHSPAARNASQASPPIHNKTASPSNKTRSPTTSNATKSPASPTSPHTSPANTRSPTPSSSPQSPNRTPVPATSSGSSTLTAGRKTVGAAMSTDTSPITSSPPKVLRLPGTQVKSDRCWILERDWPIRTCKYHVDDCKNLSLYESQDCMLCNRGFGAYATQSECEVPPTSAGPYESATKPPPVGAAPTSVDPSTYPSPTLPSPSGCSASTQSWLWGRQTDLSSPCPHWRPAWRWEDPKAWGNAGVPRENTSVTLPSNTNIMITQCSFPSGSASFTSITIPFGSQLIFDDANILLTVGTIWVQGKLSAGSPTCRLQSKITITFAPLPGINVNDMGIQVSSSGQLDMHGALYQPTWTRLSATIWPGNNWASLQQPVNWQPGQLVAIMTSIWRDEYNNQNEVATIKSVSSDGKTLTFNSNLQFIHYSGSEYQTEVALLSRNILLQSGPDVENTWRGGHVKVQGQGRLQGVMAYRLGQNNNLGAYPFHWHRIGTTNNQANYARDCSVFRSFYRCFVVHGTSGMLFQDNVGFHAQGSCFYLEDGVEEYNWYEHNLAAFVHVIGIPAGGVSQLGTTHAQASDLAHPTDAAASCFYAANTNNAYVNNAASGGWAGFSFPCLDAPIGDFAWQTSFSPCNRPLWQFTGNTVHSSGYFFSMAGGIYFGGKVWLDSTGKLYYNSGRWARDTKDDSGNRVAQVLRNNKAWLAQWGISHWGDRVTVDVWENHDCTRGANVFGDAQVTNAVLNGRSGNAWAMYPQSVWDLDPIAGFRWYDTSVRTILANITFKNWAYQPDMPITVRPSVWTSMAHSDEFKPSYISASVNITYENVDFRAFLRHVPADTGASRFFNWIDWDGSASRRGKPTVMGSFPSWWQVDSSCQTEPSSGVWMCDWLPWRTVGRLDVHVDGYTSQVGTGTALAPNPSNYAGYVAQFGYRGSTNRSMVITRNEGFSGLTGETGWYVHLSQGVTPSMRVWANQIPPGTTIIFATRYPAGTTFSITRNFKFFSWLNAQLSQVYSLNDLLSGYGESYFFNGKHLYIKMTDPGDSSVPKDFTVGNVTVWGTRFFALSYDISATNLKCSWASAGGNFCPMTDAWDDIPDFLPSFNPWSQPYCWDVPPDPQYTCAQQSSWGKCGDSIMFNKLTPLAQSIGSYCALTCGRCQPGQKFCVDNPPPGSVSYSCTQRMWNGECYKSYLRDNGWCGRTCGYCIGSGQPPCIERVPNDGWTCAQRLSWGHCSQSWMVNDHWCDVTCRRCTPCDDKTPPDGVNCAQRKNWGNCNDAWLVNGGYCRATCGKC